MTKKDLTNFNFDKTMETYFSDWEGNDCAVRTDESGAQRFIITDSTAHTIRTTADLEQRQRDADEDVARTIAFNEQ